MSDRRGGLIQRISQGARQYLGLATPDTLQAAGLMHGAEPQDYPPGLCDEASLPHDTILVQDVSGSMTWSDCVPSRLEASKQAAEGFARKRAALSPGDRIAMVTFNIHGRVVLPLTEIVQLDRILMSLSVLRGAGGTDIAEGLKAANAVFGEDIARNPALARHRRILLLTDGHGGRPLRWATHLKGAGVLLEVIGIGGDTSAVDERLLRQVATTDVNGLVHYWFFRHTEGLVAHYENLASGLVYRGQGR